MLQTTFGASCMNRASQNVSGAGIEIHTGRKWSAARELKVAEVRLQQMTMVGTVARRTKGLGYYPSPRRDNARGKERSKGALSKRSRRWHGRD